MGGQWDYSLQNQFITQDFKHVCTLLDQDEMLNVKVVVNGILDVSKINVEVLKVEKEYLADVKKKILPD